jgi:hypothetical protein
MAGLFVLFFNNQTLQIKTNGGSKFFAFTSLANVPIKAVSHALNPSNVNGQDVNVFSRGESDLVKVFSY